MESSPLADEIRTSVVAAPHAGGLQVVGLVIGVRSSHKHGKPEP